VVYLTDPTGDASISSSDESYEEKPVDDGDSVTVGVVGSIIDKEELAKSYYDEFRMKALRSWRWQ
jgi:hypothetical protein